MEERKPRIDLEYGQLSIEEKQAVFDSMTYQEKFEAILGMESEKYKTAPGEVKRAMYNAWLELDNSTGFLNTDTITELETRLGIEGIDRWQEAEKRLFVDMDGTLAVYKSCNTLEKLYEKGYFADLEPMDNVLEGIRVYKAEHPDVEVFILSAYLSDSKYALQEKNEWLDYYLPEIDQTHRIYPECGQDKSAYIPGGVRENDCLLDDYSVNLFQWERAGGKGIKLMNGINGTKGKWRGEKVSADKNPEKIGKEIWRIMETDQLIRRNELGR